MIILESQKMVEAEWPRNIAGDHVRRCVVLLILSKAVVCERFRESPVYEKEHGLRDSLALDISPIC